MEVEIYARNDVVGTIKLLMDWVVFMNLTCLASLKLNVICMKIEESTLITTTLENCVRVESKSYVINVASTLQTVYSTVTKGLCPQFA